MVDIYTLIYNITCLLNLKKYLCNQYGNIKLTDFISKTTNKLLQHKQLNKYRSFSRSDLEIEILQNRNNNR